MSSTSDNLLTENLIDFIRSNYAPEEKTKTSKNGSKTIFFRSGGKSLCYIDKTRDKSIVTIVIGASLSEKVSSSNISVSAKDKFTNAKQFHDGRWLFFEPKTEQDIQDIKSLLQIKKSLPDSS